MDKLIKDLRMVDTLLVGLYGHACAGRPELIEATDNMCVTARKLLRGVIDTLTKLESVRVRTNTVSYTEFLDGWKQLLGDKTGAEYENE